MAFFINYERVAHNRKICWLIYHISLVFLAASAQQLNAKQGDKGILVAANLHLMQLICP